MSRQGSQPALRSITRHSYRFCHFTLGRINYLRYNFFLESFLYLLTKFFYTVEIEIINFYSSSSPKKHCGKIVSETHFRADSFLVTITPFLKLFQDSFIGGSNYDYVAEKIKIQSNALKLVLSVKNHYQGHPAEFST